jgi:hypothetical protein
MHVYCLPEEVDRVESEIRTEFERMGYKPAKAIKEAMLRFNKNYPLPGPGGKRVLEWMEKAALLASDTGHLLIIRSKVAEIKNLGKAGIVYIDVLEFASGDAIDQYFIALR